MNFWDQKYDMPDYKYGKLPNRFLQEQQVRLRPASAVPLIDGGTVRLPRLVGLGHAMDLILTGRKVEAAEALQIGLCNRVVPHGQALDTAIALAEQLANFPQPTMLADRMSAYVQSDLPLTEALYQEWQLGKRCINEGLQGASRFVAGVGKHGKF